MQFRNFKNGGAKSIIQFVNMFGGDIGYIYDVAKCLSKMDKEEVDKCLLSKYQYIAGDKYTKYFLNLINGLEEK